MGYNRQPYQHHTRIPAVGVYVYSFALNPEQHQPSGTVNMSRIDNATLQLTIVPTASSQLRVYATNYNVLRIMAGEHSRQQEYIHKKNMLVKIKAILLIFATLSNCGNLLRAFTTTLTWKQLRGTQLITDLNGNNVKDWTIRIQASKILNEIMKMVQRLNVSGGNIPLRYSLVPFLKDGYPRWVDLLRSY